MLCSEVQLVKHGDGYEDIKPLPCWRWSCDYCGPQRRRRLIMQAASGEPNKILTLTVNPAIGDGPTDRRNRLHDAWKKITKRILRQFALDPERRWPLKGRARTPAAAAVVKSADSKTPRLACTKLNYMAFLERTKRGEPHLHILMRCPFIPQDWLSEQMQELNGSPICWIEQVNSTRAAIRYVTKYVTKEPAQFGNSKRYWLSRHWEVNKPDQPEQSSHDMSGISVRRKRWEETTFEFQHKDRRYTLLGDGWMRVYESRTEWEKATDRWIEHVAATA